MSSGAPQEHGTAIRMPSQALLCIDSEDANRYDKSGFKYPGTNPAQIQINKQTPLLFGYMTRLSLTEVNFQWDTPNVNPTNRTMSLKMYGEINVSGDIGPIGNYRIGLPVGWYKPVVDDPSGASLQKTLQDVLRSMPIYYTDASGNVLSETVQWDVIFDKENFNFTITCGLGNTSANPYCFNILPNSVYMNIDYTWKLPSDTLIVLLGTVEDDLTTMMGLTAPLIITDDCYPTVTGGFASCQYTPYVDIVSNILTKNQNVQDNDSTLRNGKAKLARLYLSNDKIEALTPDNIIGVRPFVFRREFATPKVISWNTTENVDVIDLQVLDYKGYPLYITPLYYEQDVGLKIGNTANFQFTIQASET